MSWRTFEKLRYAAQRSWAARRRRAAAWRVLPPGNTNAANWLLEQAVLSSGPVAVSDKFVEVTYALVEGGYLIEGRPFPTI